MRRDRDRPLYMIGVAAELTGLHPQTLRIYERRELVSPKRSAGNTRLYSDDDIDRLRLIIDLTEEGVNLAGVARILSMRDEMERMESRLERMRAVVEDAERRMKIEIERVRRANRAEIVHVRRGGIVQRRDDR
jgi:MerR family transcriptional regulator/heat shock protein HspR